MASHQARVVMTILNGQTTAELKGNDGKKFLGMARSITIIAPSVLTETVTVKVAGIKAPAAADYGAVQQSPGGADLTVGAGKAVSMPGFPAGQALALVAGVAVGADRVFNVIGQIDATEAWES